MLVDVVIPPVAEGRDAELRAWFVSRCWLAPDAALLHRRLGVPRLGAGRVRVVTTKVGGSHAPALRFT